MALDLLLFGLGLAGLYLGAEWLVGGAARLASKLGVSSLVLGLTLVSFGTSAPELVVSGMASYRGNGGLSIGNVLGSNVANIALILGVAALILPLAVRRDLLGRDIPVMLGTAVLVPIVGIGGTISRWEGALLLFLFAAYLAHLAVVARTESAGILPAEIDVPPGVDDSVSLARAGMVAVVGLVVLSVGAHLLVRSAINVATALDVSEVAIGLTLVAFGTSLPELAASVSAARRGDSQIVIGNIVGSNIFNVLLILGVSALINPLPVSAEVLRIDAPIVIGLSLVLLPMVISRRMIGRIEAGLLVLAYVGFITLTAI